MVKKEDLERFLNKLEPTLTILDYEKIYSEMEEKFSKINLETFAERELLEELSLASFYKRLATYENYIDRWDKGLFTPNDEELEKLKNHQKNLEEGKKIDEMFDSIIKSSPSTADKTKKLKKEAKESKKVLDQLIKADEYRRKIEKRLEEENKKEKEGGGYSPPQLSENDKKIASLQGKIQALEDELKQTSASENKELQQQIQQLKSELKEKEKEKEKEKNQQQQNKGDKFPWKPVLIVGGIGLGIVFVFIVILLIKKIIKS